jgi:hypothetical protein
MGVADFLAKSRNRVVSSVQAFPDIDLDGTARSLKLRERAAEAARLGQPSADSQNFDAAEYSVVHEIEADSKESVSNYLEDQKAYAERARDISSDAAIAKLKNVARDARSAFEGAVKSGKSEFFEVVRDLREVEADLSYFRQAHSLRRPAMNQGKMKSALVLLLFVLAVEALLNGYFLAKGNSFGLAGGVFEALFIAAMNIFVGFIVGRLVMPWIIYRNIAAQILAVVGTLVYLAVAIGFNLAVAHYRTAMIDNPFDAAAIAYQTLRSDPAGLHDLEGWALLAMGFAFSLVAAYKGFNSDDPYPGYGRRVRASQNALDDFNDLKEELLEKLESIKVQSERGMDEAIRSLSSRAGEHANIAAKSAARRQELLSHFSHLQASGRALLQLYRDENIKCRTDGVFPKRFSEEWQFSAPNIEHIAIVAPLPPSAEVDAKEALKEATNQRDSLHEGYREAMKVYGDIENIVQGQA